jgi:hypothetical protein
MLDCVLHTSPSVDESTLAFPARRDNRIEGAVPGRLINPVMTMNKQSITRVYFRKIPRKGNAQKESVNAPVFDSVMPDYEIPRTDLNQTLASLKRTVTPVSVQNLRRNKRAKVSRDGFKPASLPGTGRSPSSKSRSKPRPMAHESGKSCSASSEFPDLIAIDKMMTLSLTYPEIPVNEIQRVATGVCGVHPTEVTSELLQAEGSGNHMQMVVYGGQ